MITSVEIIDFLSHRDTKLEFDMGMNVIVGPNGAGKSSVVEAITFALFGEHTRGVKDSLMRHGSSGGYTCVKFKAGQREFDVTRKIKSGSPVVLREFVDGKWYNISAGERKQMGESTKIEVEKILEMDFETLQIASIIRQGELDKIVHESPKEFKTRINNIIKIDALDQAHAKMGQLIGYFRDHIREKLGYDDTHIATLQQKITDAESHIQDAKSRASSLKGARTELETTVTELEGRIASLKETASAREQRDKRLEELCQYVNSVHGKISPRISTIQDIIPECKAALEDINKEKDIGDKLKSQTSILESAELEKTKCEKTLASLDEKLEMSEKLELRDGKCPVCNSEVAKLNPLFVEEHIRKEIANTRNKLDEQTTIAFKSRQESDRLERIDKAITAATATLRAHSVNSLEDIKSLELELQKLEKTQTAADACTSGDWRAASGIDQQAQAHCEALEALEAKVGTMTDESDIDGLSDELGNARHRLENAISDLGAATSMAVTLEKEITNDKNLLSELEIVAKYIKRLDIVKDTYRRDGPVATSLRSWALSTISEACTEHLAVLDTRINRITLSEKEKSIEIMCHSRNDSFGIKSLSGGEQICVALALRLGMVRLLGTSRPTFVILDEPTAHLDAERRKSMAHVLAGLASATEAGTMQFIVITHDTEIFDESPVERKYELEAGPDGTRVLS